VRDAGESSEEADASLAFRGDTFTEMRLDMKQRVVETKADLENTKEKDDIGLFLEAGHYYCALDGVSGDTISDSLCDPIPPLLVIRGAVYAWMRLDMKQRVVKLILTTSMKRMRRHPTHIVWISTNSLAWQRGSTTSWTRP
jgi:hypothetical protein